MPVSHILHNVCATCGKRAVETNRFTIGEKVFVSLECKHSYIEDIKHATAYDFVSLTKGHIPKPFQIEGIKFAENGGLRVLIGDEQGLGKTIQVLGALKLHPEMLPCLIVTKGTLTHQFFHEIAEWCGKNEFLTQVLSSGKEKCLPGFQVYVCTYDYIKNEDAFDLLEDLNSIIIDECQAIKNHLSGRAKACQKVAERVKYVIATSGTPIKNHAGEYFTILNILRPSRFPEFKAFLDEFCDYIPTAHGYKIGGLKDHEYFRQETEDFIIRRVRAEVAPELPKVWRQFHHVELDKKLNKAYREGMQELEELMYSEESASNTAIIAIMIKLRRITGISKSTVEAVDYTTDFLESTDRKLVIFLHHKTAHTILDANLGKWMKDNGLLPPLSMDSSLNPEQRAEVVRKFRDEPYRVMIASTLAAGEGLNLQFCSDAIMLERQWNPANEEQAEGRFSRYGSTADRVNMVYFIASGTIDEYFTELVEQKRAIVSNTLDHKEMNWDENSLMKELAGVLLREGKKRWSL